MENLFNKRNAASACISGCKALLGVAVLAGALLAGNSASAQTTNAFDNAADPAYTGGAGGGNNLGALTSPNGGYGFGPWSFVLTGNGGAFIQTGGPSGYSFDMWNTGASGSTIGTRSFTSALASGESFTFSLRLNGLNNGDTNRITLQDSSGNVLFSYWHRGNEANSGNGSYMDANNTAGVATNFPYAYQSFQTFKFTLTSATTYTFSDLSSGGSFTGTIANTPIAQFSLIRRNGSTAPGTGEDFQFDQFIVTSAAPPTFALSPAAGALSVPTNGSISVSVASGGVPLNTGSAMLTLDGNPVSPTITGSSSLMDVSYAFSPALAYGSTHTATLVVQDNNTASYTNTWGFTTGYGTLPVTVQGPIVVAYTNYNDAGLALFTTNGDGWIGTNYNNSSNKTLYTRYSLEFDNLNGETGTGGGYGGLHFLLGTTQKLIVGNNWGSLNWSLESESPALLLEDLNVAGSTLPVSVGVDDWHTIVVRTDYVPNGNDTVSIYFDPDFTQTEQAWVANNPGSVTTLSSDVTFDNVYLRCGNGSATCTFSNIMVAATSDGVGFVAPADPTFQNYVPAANASSAPVSTPIGVNVLFGSYGIGTNTVTMTLDGNPVDPTFTVTANSIGINYQPPSAFAPGSAHSVEVSLTDSNNTPYYANWSFTVDSYPTLPVTMAGPFDAYEGTSITLWTSQNGWLDSSFGPNSTNTLYTRFSMVFYDFPQTDASAGGSFGGLQFFQDNTERLITGNAFTSTNWSFDAKEGGEIDVSPATPIVVGEWHTFVIKSVYASNAPTAESIWLDPDFTKTLVNQPQAPTTASLNNTFNQILLRCGNGATYAEFTNIVISATAVDLGFPPSVAPSLLSIQNGQLSWTGNGTLQNAPAVTGPWTEAADQTNPQTLSTTNAAEFYRLQQ